MMAVTYGVRQLYLKFKIRVRQWGHLPAKRGATVLITNHQHMDEGETITARTFFLHPWKPLVMCNSRRTFETGFIAARLPWSARFTRGVNLSGLWGALQHPADREPSLLTAAHQPGRRADAPHTAICTLDAILPAETRRAVGVGRLLLSDLWKLANFMRAQAWVKVAHLKQPYRREVLENLRTAAERDIAAIVERVRAGATFYVTPEGDFSRDGRMRSMRKGIVDASRPSPISGCARSLTTLSRVGRLSMLYRVLPYDRRRRSSGRR